MKACASISRMEKKAMMMSMTQPMARLRNLKRSARTRETMMLLPFCQRCGWHLLLSSRIVGVVGVVTVVGQFQEEMLQRGVLRRHLVHVGSCVDQRLHQLGRPLWWQRDCNRARPADLRRHAEACGHVSQRRERFGLDQQAGIALEQIGDATLCHHFAAIDDRYLVADLLDLVQQMAGEEDGMAARSQLLDQLANLDGARRVETVGRLVEEDDLRRVEQRGGNRQALLHTERVGLDFVLRAAAQAHLLKYPRDVARVLVPGGAREDPQVVMPQDASAALCRANKTEQHTNGRGFACAVGAEEAEDGTGVNRQVQCIDGTVPAKLFGESGHFDGEWL